MHCRIKLDNERPTQIDKKEFISVVIRQRVQASGSIEHQSLRIPCPDTKGIGTPSRCSIGIDNIDLIVVAIGNGISIRGVIVSNVRRSRTREVRGGMCYQ